jgi:hypothetical protein
MYLSGPTTEDKPRGRKFVAAPTSPTKSSQFSTAAVVTIPAFLDHHTTEELRPGGVAKVSTARESVLDKTGLGVYITVPDPQARRRSVSPRTSSVSPRANAQTVDTMGGVGAFLNDKTLPFIPGLPAREHSTTHRVGEIEEAGGVLQRERMLQSGELHDPPKSVVGNRQLPDGNKHNDGELDRVGGRLTTAGGIEAKGPAEVHRRKLVS